MREGSHGATEVTGRTGGLPWAHPTPLLRYVVLTTVPLNVTIILHTMKHIRTADFSSATSRMCCGPEGLPEGHWSWVSCCVAVNTVTVTVNESTTD